MGNAKGWEQQVRDVASKVEDDVRQVVTYINDEVVPDIRRNGSAALRAAAVELHKLAQRMDERSSAERSSDERSSAERSSPPPAAPPKP